MFCKNCGQQLPDDTKFCPECGTATDLAPQNAYYHTQAVYVKPTIPGKGLGIAAMILGIIGVFASFSSLENLISDVDYIKSIKHASDYFQSLCSRYLFDFFMNCVSSVLAFCFARSSREKGYTGGMCTAGLVLGVIGIFLNLAFLIFILVI